MLYSSPELPQDQVKALKTITVHIYGGQHGEMSLIDPYGHACLGVIDGDYEGTHKIVDALDPERGDVYAYEAIWHNPARDTAWFMQDLQEIADQSALLQVDPFDLPTFAAQAHQGMVISPPTYAECLAIQKGIRTEYADATQNARAVWLDRRRQAGEIYPPGSTESMVFRDVKIVERLGAIAVTMDMGRRWNRPILAMTVGDNHTIGIKRHLRANGVRPKIHCYSPNLSKRIHDDIQRINFGQTDHDKQQWIMNADKIISERKK